MIYLKFNSWEDYVEHVKNRGTTRIDLADCSTPEAFNFFVVATQVSESHVREEKFGEHKSTHLRAPVIAFCSEPAAIMERTEEVKARELQTLKLNMTTALERVRKIFTAAGIRVLPGIYTSEVPDILQPGK